MKVTQVEIENVLGLLAATPRRIASLSPGVEISQLHSISAELRPFSETRELMSISFYFTTGISNEL